MYVIIITDKNKLKTFKLKDKTPIEPIVDKYLICGLIDQGLKYTCRDLKAIEQFLIENVTYFESLDFSEFRNSNTFPILTEIKRVNTSDLIPPTVELYEYSLRADLDQVHGTYLNENNQITSFIIEGGLTLVIYAQLGSIIINSESYGLGLLTLIGKKP